MDAPNPLPIVARLDDTAGPEDVVDVLALRAFVAGEQPFARSRHLERVRDDAPLLPPGATVTHAVRSARLRCRLATGDGWTAHAVRWGDATAVVTVTAVSEELASRVLDDATRDAAEPASADRDEVTVGFWHAGPRHAQRSARAIAAPPWPSIRHNYASDAAVALDRLMAVDASTACGRLVLLHGPPGTGKTTALRALARAWTSWCRFDVVIDPERLFNDASYLAQVTVGDDEDDDRWRLLVLEDCDELLRADAKQGTGQALSRLLNLTDGLLGQGLEVLVCLTTNEPLRALHPAITRPGRCLAEIHVGPFPPAEAAAWLGRPVASGGRPLTLAELCARRGDVDKVAQPEEPPAVGQYL